MPNPFRFRANIDRIWRRTAEHNPGYVRLSAFNAIARELFAPNERARLNHQMYFATDKSLRWSWFVLYDVVRHQLRDLYDRAHPLDQPHCEVSEPAPEEEVSDEEDDPL